MYSNINSYDSSMHLSHLGGHVLEFLETKIGNIKKEDRGKPIKLSKAQLSAITEFFKAFNNSDVATQQLTSTLDFVQL